MSSTCRRGSVPRTRCTSWRTSLDWNGPGGFQYFSSHWPYPALTQYATDYYGPLWPFYYWDSWAEAVTAFVLGFADAYFTNDASWKDLDEGPNRLADVFGAGAAGTGGIDMRRRTRAAILLVAVTALCCAFQFCIVPTPPYAALEVGLADLSRPCSELRRLDALRAVATDETPSAQMKLRIWGAFEIAGIDIKETRYEAKRSMDLEWTSGGTKYTLNGGTADGIFAFRIAIVSFTRALSLLCPPAAMPGVDAHPSYYAAGWGYRGPQGKAYFLEIFFPEKGVSLFSAEHYFGIVVPDQPPPTGRQAPSRRRDDCSTGGDSRRGT